MASPDWGRAHISRTCPHMRSCWNVRGIVASCARAGQRQHLATGVASQGIWVVAGGPGFVIDRVWPFQQKMCACCCDWPGGSCICSSALKDRVVFLTLFVPCHGPWERTVLDPAVGALLTGRARLLNHFICVGSVKWGTLRCGAVFRGRPFPGRVS
jgi:hypothetical protein